MSLIDDAANRVNSWAARQVLQALTADGPVILLPDEGEGVRVAKLVDWLEQFVGDGSTEIDRLTDAIADGLTDLSAIIDRIDGVTS